MSKHFVVIGAPRTGSTLLVKTLNSLKSICCHGELLGPEHVRRYEDGFDPEGASKSERDNRAHRLLLERNEDPVGFIQRALTTNDAATGFKALYSAFLNPRWSEVRASLLANPDVRFIHLTRKNDLRRFISEEILHAGGPNHSGAGGRSETPIQVHIDIDTYLRNTAEVEAEGRQVISLLQEKELLDISYEQLSADTASTVATACQFLGLDIVSSDIMPALKKVGAVDLSDSVSNYQDLLDNPATRDLVLED
jgi:LPS sulfotransferase NodH